MRFWRFAPFFALAAARGLFVIRLHSLPFATYSCAFALLLILHRGSYLPPHSTVARVIRSGALPGWFVRLLYLYLCRGSGKRHGICGLIGRFCCLTYLPLPPFGFCCGGPTTFVRLNLLPFAVASLLRKLCGFSFTYHSLIGLPPTEKLVHYLLPVVTRRFGFLTVRWLAEKPFNAGSITDNAGESFTYTLPQFCGCGKKEEGIIAGVGKKSYYVRSLLPVRSLPPPTPVLTAAYRLFGLLRSGLYLRWLTFTEHTHTPTCGLLRACRLLVLYLRQAVTRVYLPGLRFGDETPLPTPPTRTLLPALLPITRQQWTFYPWWYVRFVVVITCLPFRTFCTITTTTHHRCTTWFSFIWLLYVSHTTRSFVWDWHACIPLRWFIRCPSAHHRYRGSVYRVLPVLPPTVLTFTTCLYHRWTILF